MFLLYILATNWSLKNSIKLNPNSTASSGIMKESGDFLKQEKSIKWIEIIQNNYVKNWKYPKASNNLRSVCSWKTSFVGLKRWICDLSTLDCSHLQFRGWKSQLYLSGEETWFRGQRIATRNQRGIWNQDSHRKTDINSTHIPRYRMTSKLCMQAGQPEYYNLKKLENLLHLECIPQLRGQRIENTFVFYVWA